jgi:hypothetical protein
MPPSIPELRIGSRIQRQGVVVVPLYAAQLTLFSDAVEGPPMLVGREARRVLVIDHDERGTTICNNADLPVLMLPGDQVQRGSVLTCSVLIPPGRTIRIPDLCLRAGVALPCCGGRPVSGVVGAVVVAGRTQRLDVLSSPDACRKAWSRLLAIGSSLTQNVDTGNVDGLLSRLFRLTWDRVRPVGLGSEWVAQAPGVQATALFLKQHLIHLRVCFIDL